MLPGWPEPVGSTHCALAAVRAAGHTEPEPGSHQTSLTSAASTHMNLNALVTGQLQEA